MPAHRPRKRTRDTHDPQTSLPSKLLDEISGNNDSIVVSSRKQSANGNGEDRTPSRKEERKRKRREKKEASAQARAHWKERRHGQVSKLNSTDSTQKSNPSSNEHKRSLSNLNHSATIKKHRIESNGAQDSPHLPGDNGNIGAEHVRAESTSFQADKIGHKKADSSKERPPSKVTTTVEKSKETDDPDSREIQRLEKLLGIDRLRKQKGDRGDKFVYKDVFEDGDDELVDLIEMCDRTIQGRETNAGTRAAETNVETLDENESLSGGECSSDAPSEEHAMSTFNLHAGANAADTSLNGKYDPEDRDSLHSDTEENESSKSSSGTHRSNGNNNNIVVGQSAGSDHGSQHGSQHGAHSERGELEYANGAHEIVISDPNDRQQATRTVKYTPPSARKRVRGSLDGVKRRMRGLLNRVADANASGVAHDISEMFRSTEHGLSRRDLANLYANTALDSVRDGSGVGYVNPYVLSHAAIASHLGSQVDGVVLATFLVSAVRRVTAALEESRDERETHLLVQQESAGDEVFGYVAVICALYERKAISSRVIYDLVRVTSDPLTQTRVEVLLLLLRRVGALLRMDDPASLKDMIEFIHVQARETRDSASGEPSTKFQVMLDLITDIKNNKIKKTAIKEIHSKFSWAAVPESPFSASISELLDDEFTSLRWWDQSHGLSIDERNGLSFDVDDNKERSYTDIVNESNGHDLVTLAHSLRLNTEHRKALFTTIMSSLNVSDAYDKLERMGAFEAKKNHDRDTALVILHCCGAEKAFNPFYAYLAAKMCQRSRRCRFTFEFAFCDIFRMLPGSEKSSPLPKRKVKNFYQMLAHLWATKALSLCILRRFPDLQECGENERKFVEGAMDTLLTKHGQSSDLLVPFSKLASETWSGAKAFRLSLAVFIRHNFLSTSSANKKRLVGQVLAKLEAE